MKKILKYLLEYWKITAIVYTIVYILKSFIIWEFTNPIQWIINLPIYDEHTRFIILCFYILYNIVIGLIINAFSK